MRVLGYRLLGDALLCRDLEALMPLARDETDRGKSVYSSLFLSAELVTAFREITLYNASERKERRGGRGNAMLEELDGDLLERSESREEFYRDRQVPIIIFCK